MIERLEGKDRFLAVLETGVFEPDDLSDSELLAWTLKQHIGIGLDDLLELKFKLIELV